MLPTYRMLVPFYTSLQFKLRASYWLSPTVHEDFLYTALAFHPLLDALNQNG